MPKYDNLTIGINFTENWLEQSGIINTKSLNVLYKALRRTDLNLTNVTDNYKVAGDTGIVYECVDTTDPRLFPSSALNMENATIGGQTIPINTLTTLEYVTSTFKLGPGLIDKDDTNNSFHLSTVNPNVYFKVTFDFLYSKVSANATIGDIMLSGGPNSNGPFVQIPGFIIPLKGTTQIGISRTLLIKGDNPLIINNPWLIIQTQLDQEMIVQDIAITIDTI